MVEVQKESGGRTWYIGHIVDILGKDRLLVGFDGDVWPKQEFPVSRVRKPAKVPEAGSDRFSPSAGDEVEMRMPATEHAPAGWSAGVIRSIKHGFFFVARTDSSAAEGGEAIVEESVLRPPRSSDCLEASSLQQETVNLPSHLQSWIRTSDGDGCLAHIEEQSGLVYIGCGQGGALRLLGDQRSLRSARLLLDVHMKHQSQIQSFQDVREKRLKALESKRNRIEGAGFKHSVETRIDASYVPRLIGKNGEAVRAVEEKYDVNIRIMDAKGPGEERVIRIFGHNAESLEQAKAEVEYLEHEIDIDPEMNNWVLGRAGRTVQGFRDQCGLVYAKLDRETQKLLLCGTRNAVDEAVAMFETHLMYHPVFRQMDDEMEAILEELEECGDYGARWEYLYRGDDEEPEASKGKSKGKGAKGSGKASTAVSAGTKGEKAAGGKAAGGKASGGKGSKGGASSWTPSKGGGKHWEAVDEPEEPEPEQPQQRKGEKAAKGGRGRTALPAGRGKGAGASDQKGKAAQEAPEEPEAPRPERRRMGKKGLRS